MSRIARKISKNGMYNIIFKSSSDERIFRDTEDCEQMKYFILNAKENIYIKLFTYSFSETRGQLFVKEKNPGDVSLFMKIILSRYTFWYNKKYCKKGSLFKDRYKSDPVENEGEYLNLIKYININHFNLNSSDSFCRPFCGYYEYIADSKDITNINFALNILHGNRKTALRRFEEIHNEPISQNYEISLRKDALKIRKTIMNEINGKEPTIIKTLEKSFRNELLRKLFFEKCISKSALSRATGISRSTITSIINN